MPGAERIGFSFILALEGAGMAPPDIDIKLISVIQALADERQPARERAGLLRQLAGFPRPVDGTFRVAGGTLMGVDWTFQAAGRALGGVDWTFRAAGWGSRAVGWTFQTTGWVPAVSDSTLGASRPEHPYSPIPLPHLSCVARQ